MRKWAASLPLAQIDPAERHTCLAHITANSAEMVHGTAQVLALRPDLFPDAQVSAAQILQDQRLAADYGILSRVLHGLSVRCAEQQVHHQARAAVRTKELLRQVVAGYKNQVLCPELPHRRRVLLLTPALRLLHQHRAPKGAPVTRAEKGKTARQGLRSRLADALLRGGEAP